MDAVAAAPILRIGNAIALMVRSPDAGAPEDRNRAAMTILRHGTGRDDIIISRRGSGRPALAPPYPELGISLSYSEGMLLAAFAPDGRVGVDIEFDAFNDRFDPIGFASDHFAPGEAEAVARLDSAAGRDLCHRLWVAKEAALKVSGRGIYDGLTEPDLASVVTALRDEGNVIDLPAGRSLPGLRLAVRRLHVPVYPRAYCALAYQPGGGE